MPGATQVNGNSFRVYAGDVTVREMGGCGSFLQKAIILIKELEPEPDPDLGFVLLVARWDPRGRSSYSALSSSQLPTYPVLLVFAPHSSSAHPSSPRKPLTQVGVVLSAFIGA